MYLKGGYAILSWKHFGRIVYYFGAPISSLVLQDIR